MASIVVKHVLRALFILLATFGCTSQLFAQWTKVGSFDQPFDCGFFLDANTGFIGSGNSVNTGHLQNLQVEIYKTTDGAVTWKKVITPLNSYGAVTSIFMKSPMIGYATIFDFPGTPTFDLWKTIDGGETWVDINAGINGSPTCIYVTSKAMTVTEWRDHGGSSTDDGQTFVQYFGIPNGTLSNGIDFTDDDHGVATMCESGQSTSFYFTTDGGITWSPSSVQAEAWSVYGRKCSSDFFCASEGLDNSFAGVPGHSIYWSSDGGMTWATRYTFPGPKMEFTGHIAGMRKTLYLQTDTVTDLGLFRSDDLGLSWKSVGGPSNHRDTRFVVTGISGEVVYAFDTAGNVWKTTDGGDGTLHATPLSSSEVLALPFDSVQLTARDCQPDTETVVLTNIGCSSLTVDSAILSPNTFSEFGANILSAQLPSSMRDTVRVIFAPHNAPQHASILRVYGHSNTGPFDTTITITGVNFSIIDPEFGPAQKAFIADTIDVPIFLHQTNDPFSISSLSLTYTFNGDILTPVAIVTAGTLSDKAKTGFGSSSTGATLVIEDTLSSALTQPATDFSKPLIIVRFFVTLSKSTFTTISMTGLTVNNAAPLTLCSTPSEDFTAELRCGDSTIKVLLLGQDLGTLLSVAPNPVTDRVLDVWYELKTGGETTIELLDSKGAVVESLANPLVRASGKYHEQLSLTSLSSGSYFLRLRINGVVANTFKLIRD